MVYTIKIRDKSRKAKSIINMLKALQNDYDFIEMQKDSNKVSDLNLDKDLDKRYKSFQKNQNGKDWIDLKKELK